MTAPPKTSYRLVVPVPPGGWLAGLLPHDETERTDLDAAWYDSAHRSLVAAGLRDLGRLAATVEFRPQRRGTAGMHHPEDLRMSWNPVRLACSAVGIRVFRDRLRFGYSTGVGDPLMVVSFSEVPRG